MTGTFIILKPRERERERERERVPRTRGRGEGEEGGTAILIFLWARYESSISNGRVREEKERRGRERGK